LKTTGNEATVAILFLSILHIQYGNANMINIYKKRMEGIYDWKQNRNGWMENMDDGKNIDG
jgi:hypothetical protein